MKKKIFVTRRLLRENEEKLKTLFEVTLNKDDKIYTPQEIIDGSKNYDGILSSVTDPINANTISKLSDSVKIIANGAVGFGNIDIQAAKEKGITVTNTPDVLTDATADIQILLLLGASRKAYEGRIAAETQNWKWSWYFLLGKQMSYKRLGILGMGRIGRAVAKRAKAFNMEIHYHNRSKLSPDLEDGAIYHKDLKSLLEKSEFLSINCPATPETKNLINKETLSYLEDNTVIGNAARGDVVDDDAMVEALKNGKVFAYGLDVYNGEPKIHPEYLKLKNIFLLPHLGSATKRTRWDMAYRATKNLEEFFSGKKPQDKVN
jgi:lactate dehydrogenase-like 2-hydroxyacid dehydrogenase